MSAASTGRTNDYDIINDAMIREGKKGRYPMTETEFEKAEDAVMAEALINIHKYCLNRGCDKCIWAPALESKQLCRLPVLSGGQEAYLKEIIKKVKA